MGLIFVVIGPTGGSLFQRVCSTKHSYQNLFKMFRIHTRQISIDTTMLRDYLPLTTDNFIHYHIISYNIDTKFIFRTFNWLLALILFSFSLMRRSMRVARFAQDYYTIAVR